MSAAAQLGRVERECLDYFRRTGVHASPVHSARFGGILTLRDAHGNLLTEIADGLETTSDAVIPQLVVEPFVFALRCPTCRRRMLTASDIYRGREIVSCPRCRTVAITPSDPLAASRDEA